MIIQDKKFTLFSISVDCNIGYILAYVFRRRFTISSYKTGGKKYVK